MRQHARPTKPRMDPKAVKRLLTERVLAIAGFAAKAPTPIGSRKLADGKRETVDDADGGIVAQLFIPDQAPEALLHLPQVGCLADKRGAMQARQCWEEVAPMALEVGKKLGIL